MKVIVSGGGTGGHIYPALTIADQIKKLRPDAEILFVGTHHGMEGDIVPRYGLPIEFIRVAGFSRHLGLSTLKSLYEVFTGLGDAWKLLGRYEPDLVIGTGGYVCGPVVLLAALNGIPTCIQEQNALPGVTNKILAHFVQKLFLGYREAAKYFSGKAEKIYSGNPIRDEIMLAHKAQGLAEFGLSPDKRTILVSGGSLGAVSLNQAMFEVEKLFSGREDVQVLHATGVKKYDAYMEQVQAAGGFASNIVIEPYIHDMPSALAAADIAVFRSGAIALAELTARGVAGILVPFPFATANHQEFNARALEAAGAAKVILDKDLTADKLQEVIENLLIEKDELQRMQTAARKLGRPQAAQEIAQGALALVKTVKATKERSR